MKILSVYDKEFERYGKVIEGYDFSELIGVLEQADCPDDEVAYVPSYGPLEEFPDAKQISDNIYGGMPVQIGYCNGVNRKLNCLEYHRDSEVNIAATEIIVMVAPLQEVKNNSIDSSKVEAFRQPKGVPVQLYETTLHYAPASTEGKFRVAVVLPRGTNTEKPDIKIMNDEDKLLRGRNKWLIAHKDTDEAKDGAYVGLTGENIEL